MTPRENFITALECKQPESIVPHFELAFFLTMEAFGKVHPAHRNYTQWLQMSERERTLHRIDIAQLYISIAEKYGHSAIFFHPPHGWGQLEVDETLRIIDMIRDQTDSKYFLMIHGDATFGLPEGNELSDFIERLASSPRKLKEHAQYKVENSIRRAQLFQKHGGLDGFALCSDYCFNTGPFLSPQMFDEFVTPYLTELIEGYRQMGFYTIKHTDGNIMPILDSLISSNPHALHSLDPQGGIDIREIKKMIGNKVCLIGNVNCSLMDTGTDQEVIESASYALDYGMPGGGYIFSTSNCIYTGMDLRRYELILDVWRKKGCY